MPRGQHSSMINSRITREPNINLIQQLCTGFAQSSIPGEGHPPIILANFMHESLFLWSLRVYTVWVKCCEWLVCLCSAGWYERLAQPRLQNEEFRAFPHRQTGQICHVLNRLPLSWYTGKSRHIKRVPKNVDVHSFVVFFSNEALEGAAARWQNSFFQFFCVRCRHD